MCTFLDLSLHQHQNPRPTLITLEYGRIYQKLLLLPLMCFYGYNMFEHTAFMCVCICVYICMCICICVHMYVCVCIKCVYELIKRGTRSLWLCVPDFLKLLWFVRWYAYVSVCPPPRALITSGVIWCDIGRVRLVKQVSRLFPTFNYFICHLPSIKRMGVAILTQHVMNTCQRKLKWCDTSYKRTTGKTEHW